MKENTQYFTGVICLSDVIKQISCVKYLQVALTDDGKFEEQIEKGALKAKQTCGWPAVFTLEMKTF